MPLDFSPYLPKQQSPLDVQNALMHRDALAAQMQQNQLAVQQQQQQRAEAEAVRQAVIASGGDPTRTRQALVQGGHVEPLMKWDKTQADLAESQSKVAKEKTQERGLSIDNMHKVTSELASRWGTVKAPQDVVPLYQQAVNDGLMTREAAIAEIEKTPTDAKAFAQHASDQQQRGLSMAEKFKQLMDERKQGQVERNDMVLPDGSINRPLVGAKLAVAKAGASNVSVNTGQKGYENESKLRNDFKSEPIYKDFADMQQAHQQIKAGIKSENAIGDVAAATKIMKLLDPGSVVRESELAIAMAAAGKMDRLRNYADMWVTGKKLTPTQRQEFGKLSDELMEAATQGYNKKRGEYEKMGQRYGLDPTVLGDPGKTTTGKLTASEQSELEALRKQFGKR